MEAVVAGTPQLIPEALSATERLAAADEDVASLALPVMRHRVLTNYFAESDGIDTDKVLTDLVQQLGAGERKNARVG